MSQPVEPISRRVRAAIRRLGVTNYRVAHDAGVVESTLHRFMNGGAPSLATLEHLLGYLGWDIGPAPSRRRTRR